MTREQISVFVPALVKGKGRPRATRTGRMYTPSDTRNAESLIAMHWSLAGGPRLPDGPIVVDVLVWMDRPKAHFRADGELNARGEASFFPTRKPDADNALKLVLDSLNGRAWRDDAQVVDARVRKLWTDGLSLQQAGTTINGWVMV